MMRATILVVAFATLTSAAVAAAPQAKRKAAAPAPKAAPKPAAKAAPAVFYDFKGARLGMSKAEWKALPVPATGYDDPEYAAPFALCKSDLTPEESSRLSDFDVYSEEAKLGVEECGYGHRRIKPRSYGINFERLYMKVGDGATNDVAYKFLNDKLVAIEIMGKTLLYDGVLEGLRAKFGPPTTDVRDTTQNKMGATFPHSIKMWVNPVAGIYVETPYYKIDDFWVRYSLTEFDAKLKATREATNPASEKM